MTEHVIVSILLTVWWEEAYCVNLSCMNKKDYYIIRLDFFSTKTDKFWHHFHIFYVKYSIRKINVISLSVENNTIRFNLFQTNWNSKQKSC